MHHLAKFLIGIRHKKLFRFSDFWGYLVDESVSLFPDKFPRIDISQPNIAFTLRDEKKYWESNFNQEGFTVQCQKIYDYVEQRKYVEVDQHETMHIADQFFSLTSDILTLENTINRIGMIFEFSIPVSAIQKYSTVSQLICNNFIKFGKLSQVSEGMVRFSYKMDTGNTNRPNAKRSYKNVIVMIHETEGINEEGKREKGLLAHFDIQQYFYPLQRKVDIKKHFQFSKEYIDSVLFPEFKNLGVDFSW